MYIIIKKTPNSLDQVINVCYTQISFIENWINNYIDTDIESLKMKPLERDIKNVAYARENISENTIQLIKSFKKVNRGYIYNSSEKLQEIIYSIQILEFTSTAEHDINVESSQLWQSLNAQINIRILKQLDKESLYQIFIKLQNAIFSKHSFNRTEYLSLLSEIIKSFKKELYSSITKKMKRFGQKPHQIYSSCKLEYKTKKE